MRDMEPADVGGSTFVEHTLTYHDGTKRRILAVDREVPFPDGKLIVSVTDLAGIVTHCNQAFVDMSGFSQEEILGQPHHILRHPDMPAAAFADLWTTIQKGDKWHGYVKNLRKDGAYYWVHAIAVPNVRDGRIVGYTSVRRKPSRAKIDAASALYSTMNQA